MNSSLREIDSCEVCGNARLTPVLNLGAHPMCDDLVPVGDPRTCREYPIEILLCETCFTAHQRFQIPKHDLFPESYHYRSRFTGDVLRGMADLIASCEQRYGSLKGKTVLDVGCNDGSLLDFFRQAGAITVGIEPTGAAREAEAKAHAIIHGYLSEETAAAIVERHGKPDFITFTNVFAHIENLPQMLASLRILMGPETVTVIENHYLGAVLERNQFDTFYHEHPRSYSYTSFVHIARSLGTELLQVEFPSRYGGNIRVFLGKRRGTAETATVDKAALHERESGFLAEFEKMRGNMERWRKAKARVVAELLSRGGKLRAKAFPGRAAILVKLLGLDDKSLESVYEKPGSLKVGHYVPGTRVPILSDENLFAEADQTRPMLNLAWHIPVEIREYLSKEGYTGEIVDILSAEDFLAAK